MIDIDKLKLNDNEFDFNELSDNFKANYFRYLALGGRMDEQSYFKFIYEPNLKGNTYEAEFEVVDNSFTQSSNISLKSPVE